MYARVLTAGLYGLSGEPTWVEIYRVDALTEDSAKLTVNGEKHASVTVNTPFEIRMINDNVQGATAIRNGTLVVDFATGIIGIGR